MTARKVRSEKATTYTVAKNENGDDEIIARALAILAARVSTADAFENTRTVADYLTVRYAGSGREIFAVCYLNSRHRLIDCIDLFAGSIDSCTVHPREVVRRALELNAAALILCHNHPSGCPEPSQADVQITRRITEACKLVEVRVLDHFVVAGLGHVSLAERGML